MVLFEFHDILTYVGQIKDFFTNIYNVLMIVFGFLPSPFDKIALGFCVVIIALLIVKVIRG